MPDGFGAQQIRNILASAETVDLEPPRPLMRPLPPATPFPDDALGKILGPAARAINDRVRAPMAICAQSVLGAANLAVQAHGDVELPIGRGVAKPCSNFFVTVAATGERKSASDAEAAAPVRRREQMLREQYDAEHPAYLNEKMAWDKAREATARKLKDDRAAIRQALEAFGPEPKPPLIPLLTCPEPTFEGLLKLFQTGQPSLGLFAEEGGQFIGGHGLAQDNKLKTSAGLSTLWDGGVIRRVRVGDGMVIMPNRRLCMHVMAQPGVADILFRDPLLADQGLLSRLLVTAPESAAGTRIWREEHPDTDAALKRYYGVLLTILEMKPKLVAGKPNELEPRRLVLSHDARRIWISFSNYVEKAIAPNGDFAPIAGLANKLTEHAARLAAVLTLVRDIDAGEITGEDMAAGVELAQHYAAEALRLFGTNSVAPDLHLAQAALVWMRSPSWGKTLISLQDLYQRGPNAIRESAVARRIVGILEEHGYLTRVEQGAEIDGVHRREVWKIFQG
jgi:Protein of unknown function (DUF3987)